MGIEDHGRNPGSGHAGRPVVAFDFDGTLTVRDSFNAFLAWRCGGARLAGGLLRLTPAAMRYAVDRDRGRLKAAAVGEFLAGRPEAEIADAAAQFAAAGYERLMRPDALKVWEGWRARGATCVIVTASPELLAAPFARRLGADRLIGTRLATDPGTGRLTGAIAGRNCRAEEKVARLEQVFGPGLRLTAAYGDSAGDREMLAIADAPGYRVFRERPGKASSPRLGEEVG
jgi:phosphatidylglycerophosphatase C